MVIFKLNTYEETLTGFVTLIPDTTGYNSLLLFLLLLSLAMLDFGFAHKQNIFVWITPVTILVNELHIQSETRVPVLT